MKTKTFLLFTCLLVVLSYTSVVHAAVQTVSPAQSDLTATPAALTTQAEKTEASTSIPTGFAPTTESTSEPTIATSAAPIAASQTDKPTPPAAGSQQNNWPWVLVISVLAMFMFTYFKRWMSQSKPAAEQCAKCGYVLTGKSGPCPQCGSTKRLPRYR